MKRKIIILLLALIGWLLCGAIIATGRKAASLETAIIIHSLLVPIVFAAISFIYFKRFNHYSPLKTASFFLLFIVFMDFSVAAMLIEKNFSMFSSILGTWIPFLSIFLSTFLTGVIINKHNRPRDSES